MFTSCGEMLEYEEEALGSTCAGWLVVRLRGRAQVIDLLSVNQGWTRCMRRDGDLVTMLWCGGEESLT